MALVHILEVRLWLVCRLVVVAKVAMKSFPGWRFDR